MASKNHHYVPKTILRRFCFEGDSLFLFDGERPELGYRQRNISKAFQSFHLNSYLREDGTKDDEIEETLAKEIDHPLGVALKELERGYPFDLKDSSRIAIARYICSAIMRAPNLRLWLRNLLQECGIDFNAIASLYRGSGDVSLGANPPVDLNDYFLKSLANNPPDDIVERLVQGTLVVSVPKDNREEFCISDMPFIRYDDPRIAAKGIANEIYFPVSRRMAISIIVGSFLSERTILLPLPPRYVRKINFDIANRSRFVAAACPWQLHRTVRNLAFPIHTRSLLPTDPAQFV